jgi:hypothetical protein
MQRALCSYLEGEGAKIFEDRESLAEPQNGRMRPVRSAILC